MLLQPGDGLEVMVEHLGRGGEDDVDQLAAPVEIGREHLDRGTGSPAHGQDALAEVFGAAVGKVVARDGGDDHVAQSQPVARFGQALGLVEGDLLGLPALDRAKAAGPRADVSQDHERRRAAGPALRAVRATRTLADGLQAQLADQASRERHPARGGDRPLEPLGQSAPRRRALPGRKPAAGSAGAPDPRQGPAGSASPVVQPGLGA